MNACFGSNTFLIFRNGFHEKSYLILMIVFNGGGGGLVIRLMFIFQANSNDRIYVFCLVSVGNCD